LGGGETGAQRGRFIIIYNLGTLLHEARDDFIKERRMDLGLRSTRSMHLAFQRAAELAPDSVRVCLSFTAGIVLRFGDAGLGRRP